MESKLIDHLFRYHSGKMVSVLTRIFGLSHLEIIEDAVQDTFIKASISWRKQQPQHPEAWLTQAAKNRVLDLFRKLKTEKNHLPQLQQSRDFIAVNDLFLDTEIEDAQLRMMKFIKKLKTFTIIVFTLLFFNCKDKQKTEISPQWNYEYIKGFGEFKKSSYTFCSIIPKINNYDYKVGTWAFYSPQKVKIAEGVFDAELVKIDDHV